MSDKNEVEFRVRVTDDGLAPLASKLQKVDQATDELGKSASTTGQQLGGIGTTADPALETVYRRGRKAADGIESISLQLQRVQNGLIALGLGDSFVNMIKGAAQTADEYNNLAARIQLAAGEGELFEQAMDRVQQIALGTNSSLASTGDLFARLTTAGKDAGLSAEAAASQALALTESINQAVQLSGASAQASDAALTQLIQGLNGGALRGEEFNSVMEQSPRLARALADGLGVTTGELRKMAEQGRLTSDVVIGALKSQADTLKSEFETLPPTVGRAVQNLSTAWTIYIGETDKATGASKTAAQAINVLAENLDTMAGYLIDAGQAAAAFAALKLAQTFTGIGAAATTSATAIAANTVAINAAGAASTTAATNVGRFAAILGGLKTFTLLGLITNFQDIGKWIGEGIAKLQGYKDKTEELEKAERSRVAVADEQRRIVEAQVAAHRAATDAQFELSKAAQSSLAVFDDLVGKGKTAAEAVAEIGKDFDLASLPGIANAAAVLDKLAADGKISADQFRQAWANALKGEDLQAFEVNARAALAGTTRESERLAAIMDGTLREAIRRSGADFDALAGGMSKAARSAINDTDTIIAGLGRLRTQGVDVGRALEASLNRGIKTADSQAAIEALRARVEQVRKILGDQVVDGLLKSIEDQARKAVTGVTELDAALRLLGVKTRADLQKTADEFKGAFDTALKSGTLTADGLQQAFRRYAEAAIAANNGVATQTLKTEAAMRGLEIVTDATGKTIVRSMKEARDATNSAGEEANRAAGGYRNMAQSAEAAAAAAERAARYARPAGGSIVGGTREERLAGQNAVDNTLAFALRDKLNAGQLTKDDADDIRAVIAALDQNEAVNRDLDRLNPGAFSAAGMADRNEWRAVRQRLEQALGSASMGGAASPGSATPNTDRPSTTHTVTINIGGRSANIRTASAQDSDALADVLRQLEHAAGRA